MKFRLFCIILILFICCSFSSVTAAELNETTSEIGIDNYLNENSTLTIDTDDSSEKISNSDNVQSDSAITNNTSHKKIYGIVDFGSNNIKLDIYQYNTETNKIKLLSQYGNTSVIKEYTEDNNITEKGINYLITIFEDFNEILEQYNADDIYCYATASLRNIDNSAKIIDTIKNKTGFTINLLTGEQEANFSFNSVKEEFEVNNGLFIDLGGGSCEIITFENKTPLLKDSLTIGSYSAYKKFVKEIFPNENETKEIENFTLNKLKNSNITSISSINDLYINGGSISNIRKVLIYLDYIPEKNRTFGVENLDYILDEFNDTTKDYDWLPSIIGDEINTLVPGTIIIKTIANYFNITTLHDCKNKMSLGVLMSLLEDRKITITTNGLEKYYLSPEKLIVNVTDSKNNPIVNQTVQFTINGITYNRTTDENSSASLNINLNPGQYPVCIIVNYASTDAEVNILPTVNGSDITKIYRNATQYHATFKDSQGNYLAEGTTVTFYINGVFYEREITGDKGLATLNINLEQGEYIITAVNTETGESTANKITVLPKITENCDLIKKYKNESQYTVKILDDDGTSVGAGINVTFNINGIFYTRQTDEFGIVKLNINLMPGEYIITSEYEGCMVSNKITVLSN